MCGIAGVITGDRRLAERAIGPMTACQVHRGPDDEGIEVLDMGGGAVALGHRRLSIIDLSEHGHEPMVDEASGDRLVYNGELYNFRRLRAELETEGVRFRGHSDSEVVLQALVRWGAPALERFEGMYALAWARPRDGVVTLARDSIGIKPLFWARTPGGLFFASEVRAVLASGEVDRSIDRQGLAGLLAYGAVQEPCTFFKQIRAFPAGAVAEIRVDRALGAEGLPTPRRFWSMPARDASITEADARETLATTLDEAVRDHLVADVPVGVFLSSGLDSTITAGLAARHLPGVRCFTVGFADNPDMSEAPMASRTADAFGLEHHDIQVTGADAEAACRTWLETQDQPSMDGLNVYLVAGAVKREGITVALSGQGGDELFGGYPSFRDAPRLMKAVRMMGPSPAPLRALAANVLMARKNEATRQKARDAFVTDGSVLETFFACRRVISTTQLDRLGVRAGDLGLTRTFLPPEAMEGVVWDDADPVWSLSQLESRFYMGNMLLHDGDTNGMAHSLEIRVPLLDQRMLDYFLRAPGSARLPHGGNNKHLLRTAFPELLRPEILEQRKVGFILPIKRWMRGPLREMCEGGLDHLKDLGVLRREGVDAIWSTFLAESEHPIWSRAFTLCVLGLYTRRMGVTG